jgi:hypothetical protein
MDPAVQFTDVQRKRYNDIVTDLHDLHRRGSQMATALNGLFGQMTDITAKLKDMNDVPTAVKTQYDALDKEFDALRTKFGVPLGAQGGGRGGRGGGGAGAGGAAGRGQGAGGGGAGAAQTAAPETAQQETPPGGAAGGGTGGFGGGGAPDTSLVGKVATLKNQIMSIWEMPSETYVKQYNDLKASLPKAIADANTFLIKAMTVSQTLAKYRLTLTVPAPVK